MPYQPRIAIVGGGPAGLALGLLLHRHGSRPTIYELRTRLSTEELAKPSGMLDLHEESGLKVIRECGLYEDFEAALGQCSEECRVLDPQGTVLHMDEGGLEYRPEIARNALAEILIRSLPAGCIKWEHKITAVDISRNVITGAKEVILDLGAKGTSTYDFVVGADGAWSKVRKLLTDVKPFYSGAQWMTATVRNASTRYPHLVELCGSGTLNALGHRHGIMTQRGPQDSIRVYAAVSTPEEKWVVTKELDGKTAAETKTTLIGEEGIFHNWAASLKNLLATACNEETKDNPGKPADIVPMYMLPVGNRWTNQPGLTLVGDAAHLMTPWAGEGVNLALWDSLDLVHALAGTPEVENAVEWQAVVEPRIRDYEEAMLARAQEKAEETATNKDTFLSEDGGQRMADMFGRAYGSIAIGET